MGLRSGEKSIRTELHQGWKAVTMNNAKCDRCNKRDPGVKQRCLQCNLTICRECSRSGKLKDSKHNIDYDAVRWDKNAIRGKSIVKKSIVKKSKAKRSKKRPGKKTECPRERPQGRTVIVIDSSEDEDSPALAPRTAPRSGKPTRTSESCSSDPTQGDMSGRGDSRETDDADSEVARILADMARLGDHYYDKSGNSQDMPPELHLHEAASTQEHGSNQLPDRAGYDGQRRTGPNALCEQITRHGQGTEQCSQKPDIPGSRIGRNSDASTYGLSKKRKAATLQDHTQPVYSLADSQGHAHGTNKHSSAQIYAHDVPLQPFKRVAIEDRYSFKSPRHTTSSESYVRREARPGMSSLYAPENNTQETAVIPLRQQNERSRSRYTDDRNTYSHA